MNTYLYVHTHTRAYSFLWLVAVRDVRHISTTAVGLTLPNAAEERERDRPAILSRRRDALKYSRTLGGIKAWVRGQEGGGGGWAGSIFGAPGVGCIYYGCQYVLAKVKAKVVTS